MKRNIDEREGADKLSAREKDVVRCKLERDWTAGQIGRHLGITENTVTSTLKRAYRKLNVGSTTELYRWALINGVTAIPGYKLLPISPFPGVKLTGGNYDAV